MTKFTALSRESTPRELKFSYPVVLQPGIEYTLSLTQTNEVSSYISDGQSSVDYSDLIPDLTVEYSNGDGSDNGTSVGAGALPSLYFVKWSSLSPALRS